MKVEGEFMFSLSARAARVLPLLLLFAAPLQAQTPLVANGGFENGLAGWSAVHPEGFDKGTIEVQSAEAKEGKNALKLSAATGNTVVGVLSGAIPVQSGRFYALRGWYKTSGEPERLEIRVRPLDEKGGGLTPWQEYNYNFVGLAPASSWRRIDRPIIVHPTAKAMDITLWWSKGVGAVMYDDIQLVPIDAPEVAAVGYVLPKISNASATFWVEDALKKVYPDSTAPRATGEAISFSAAKGEAESAQVVVLPRSAVANLRATFDDWRGPGVLPKQNLSARFVGYVNVDVPRASFARKGLIPDPLLFDAPQLQANRPQPVWITVRVPRDVAAGNYESTLRLRGDGLNEVAIPLRLRVFDFALPPAPALTTISRIWQHHPGERDLFRQNVRDQRSAGESTIGNLPIKVSPEGKVEINWTEWDAAAQKYFGEFGFTVFNVPHVYLGDASGFYNKERKWNGLEIGSEVWQRAFADYAKQVGDHLRERGWLKYALWQVWDEPASAEMKATVKLLADLIHQSAPDARVYLTTHPQAELFGAVNIWNVPHSVFDPEAVAARQKAGDTIWFYDNSLYSLDPDASSIRLRTYPWSLYRYGIKGVEWWAISQWKSDPYTVPNQYAPQNGGGFFLYPNPAGKGAPVDSMRWEAYRDGAEDYDYLALLAQAQDAALQKLAVRDAALSGDALAGVLLKPVAGEGFQGTLDPARLAQTRAAIASLISFSRAAPAVAVRFEPAAQNKIKVSGVALPGTTITSGKTRVAVGRDKKFSLTATGGESVRFTNGQSSKTLVVPRLW
jgi:hypothetical protein